MKLWPSSEKRGEGPAVTEKNDSAVDPIHSHSDSRRKAAWDQFYQHCFSIIASSSAVRRLSEVDREDCVQEVMTEIVRRFGDARVDVPSEDVKGLLLTLSRNKAADIVRRKYRKPEVSFEDGAGASLPSSVRTPHTSVGPDLAESLSLVWEALTSLDQEVPMTSYLAFYLRTIEDWSIPEIAELLQISPEMTRVRCHRVKKRFTEILGKQDSESDVTSLD